MDIQEQMAQILSEATVDETPVASEIAETPKEPESVPAPTEEPKKTFKVKHNKQEVELTEEQANEAIQYGLYVKDRGGITPIKWFDEQAKAAGFDSLAAYQKALKEANEQREVARLVEEDALPEEVATELVQARMEKAERAQAEAEPEVDADDLVEEMREFHKLFPDVDVENLPESVLAEKKANRGRSVVDIYARYAVQQYNQNRQIEDSQRQAAETSTPSLQGAADTPDLYAFIDDIIFKKKE